MVKKFVKSRYCAIVLCFLALGFILGLGFEIGGYAWWVGMIAGLMIPIIGMIWLFLSLPKDGTPSCEYKTFGGWACSNIAQYTITFRAQSRESFNHEAVESPMYVCRDHHPFIGKNKEVMIGMMTAREIVVEHISNIRGMSRELYQE